MGAGARDIHEEGFWIPLLKLYEAGVPNKTLFHIIRKNVREPEHVSGTSQHRFRPAASALNGSRRYASATISTIFRNFRMRSSTARRTRPARRSAS